MAARRSRSRHYFVLLVVNAPGRREAEIGLSAFLYADFYLRHVTAWRYSPNPASMWVTVADDPFSYEYPENVASSFHLSVETIYDQLILGRLEFHRYAPHHPVNKYCFVDFVSFHRSVNADRETRM